MITLTRLNGQVFAVNPDHIERIDVTPTTVITLLEGTKYVVAESLEEIVDRVCAFRARVVRLATDAGDHPTPELRLVKGD